VKLLTGRTHQIRAQFAHLGWPLKNDTMYRKGYVREEAECTHDVFNTNLKLRCFRVEFEFQGKHYDVQAPPERLE